MISIKSISGNFLFRIAGILLYENKILIQRAIKNGAWVLLGGRSEINEKSEETLKRELKEELGIEISTNRLVWVVENFNAYGVEDLHEVGFYYLVELDNKCPISSLEGEFQGNENNIKLIFKWVEIDEIENLDIYPLFLKHAFKVLPNSTTHIINNDL